ncbi:unnamed protein product [Discula destructiva]
MTRLPQTTAVPDPASLFSPPTSAAVPAMSSTTPSPSPSPSTATATAGPAATPPPGGLTAGATHEEPPVPQEEAEEAAKDFRLPKLRLIIEDISHPGASRFLSASNASSVLEKSAKQVLHHLYKKPSHMIPGTRSITVYLESMDGVAYTTGSSLDNDHKEIHFSLNYIAGIKKAPDGATGDVTGAYEIAGVLVHEMVHCYQHNGRGKCNPMLIEGIADWVRLQAHLGAAHWQRGRVPDRWDQGYERTAFFLEWLETKFGEGKVREMNEKLREEEYVEAKFWDDLFGAEVDSLFRKYVRSLKGEQEH